MVATLRVATWNIRSAIGPGPFPDRWWSRIDADRLRAIGEVLAGLDADVVALQEVALLSRDGDLVDNAGDLARWLTADVRYGAVRTFEVLEGDGGSRGAGVFGNAILSRRPIRDARTIALPRAPDDALVEAEGSGRPAAGVRYRDAPPGIREPRCLLIAEIGGLAVGTAHLSHVGSGERLLQARALAEAFAAHDRAVLLGDLNARIDAPELAPLAGWDDALRAPADHPARVSTDDGYAIDHVLVRGVEVVGAGRVVREAGALSDHYPVVADLGLGRTA